MKIVKKTLVSIIFIFLFVYLAPIILELNSASLWDIVSNRDGIFYALSRSILFSIMCAIIITSISFLIAVYIHSFKDTTLMNSLILPFSFGNIGMSFIFKMLLFDSFIQEYIINSGIFIQSISLLLLQFWFLGTLFVYLFWMNFAKIPRHTFEYYQSYKIQFKYIIKDVLLPNSKNLYMIFTIISFVLSLYEDSKIQIIFKASRGMGNELVNHWLFRNYQSNLLVNLDYARSLLFGYSSWIMLISFLIISLLVCYLIYKQRKLFGFNSFFKWNIFNYFKENRSTKYLVLLLSLIVVFPIIFTLSNLKFSKSFDYSPLITSLTLTIIGSAFSVSLIILFIFSLKLTFTRYMNNLNIYTSIQIIVLFLILLFSPIAIIINNYLWFGLLGIATIKIYLIWFFSHFLLLLPIIGSFVISLFFIVNNFEIEYLKLHKISTYSILVQSFLKRFKLEFILIYLLTFTIIWNDKTANILVSDWIPSFAQKLELATIGRGADYELAFGFFIVGFLINISIFILWSSIIKKYID